MLKNLPLEVLETICFYVNIEDLVNIWDVVGMEGSESFWRKICKRQGYKEITFENSLWKNVFLQNINWLTQHFVKRTYELEPNNIDGQTCSLQNERLLLGKHLIVNSCGGETLVWDLSSSPNIVQRLSAKYISHKGSKLLTYSSSEVAVYSYNTNTFSKLYELPVKLPFNFLNFCSLTEDYLVVFDKNSSSIKTVNLRGLTESSLTISVTMSRFFLLTLSNEILFLLTLEESNYIIKRFNLMDKIWLQDLVLFQCAALIGVPQLEVSSNLIVSWSNRLEGPGITPVKVFDLDGKYIASLPFTSCLESSGTKVNLPIENISWIIVECDFLIFSTSNKSVSIWSTENPNYIMVMPKEDELHNGQEVVSSSLLVLSYSYCFKVIDFKKSVYLYEVLLDNQCSQDAFQNLHYFVNEYFYIHFQYVAEDEDNTKLTNNKMLPLASSLCLNYDSKGFSKKKCFVHIYDFTRINSL